MCIQKGAAIYVSAADLEGLSQARGLLEMLVEAANTISPEMADALASIDSVSDKARKTRRATARRRVVAKALKVAAESGH